MNPEEDREQRLERVVGAALSQLPLRRAPASLQRRVMQQLEMRMHLPWWRRSFAHWPGVAKLAFVLASAVIAVGVLEGLPRLLSAFEPASQKLENSMSVLTTLTHVITRLVEALPSQWIQLGLAFGACVYILFFALGAVAYRALYIPNRPSGFSRT